MGAARDIPLYVEAAGGSVDAYLELMKACRTAADTGMLAQEEGLALTELFGRFAVCMGHGEALPSLIKALLSRCAYEHEFGNEARGCHAGAQALRRLNHAADHGDEEAATALYELSGHLPTAVVQMASDWQDPRIAAELDGYDEMFRSAGQGDLNAVQEIASIVFDEMNDGSMSRLEGLTLIESVTRLGAVQDDIRCTEALAGALLLRAGLSREGGVLDKTHYSEVLALTLLSELAERGHQPACEALKAALREVHPQASLLAAAGHPIVLSALCPEGKC